MSNPLHIGLVAHDAQKETLSNWVSEHKSALQCHQFYATGTTWKILTAAHENLKIVRLKSGPLGGDQQLGAMICEEKLDMLIFFQDPLTAQPHDVDVKALIRLSTLYNIPIACNPATASLLMAGLS
jgi:methylglyoxal synthase